MDVDKTTAKCTFQYRNRSQQTHIVTPGQGGSIGLSDSNMCRLQKVVLRQLIAQDVSRMSIYLDHKLEKGKCSCPPPALDSDQGQEYNDVCEITSNCPYRCEKPC